MLAVKVETPNIDEVLRKFADLPQAITRTVIFSLNDTVDDLHKRQLMEMESAFDRPTAYVKRGLRKRYAAGRERSGFRAPGAQVAGLYFEDFPVGKSPEDIIKPHVYGGARGFKRNERRLPDAVWRGEGGKYNLGSGWYGIMGKDYPKNRNGNITGARYSEALSRLGTIDTARPGQKRGSSKKGASRAYFILVTGGRPVAVMERTGPRYPIIPMLALTRKTPQYPKRYRYFEVGQQQVMASLPRHFNRIMNKEMRKHFG
jgi:hypothetical protein